jgi:hypothetical protein
LNKKERGKIKLSDYQKEEQPTGEEVRNIVKFYWNMQRENINHKHHQLDTEIKKSRKITAILIAICTAVITALVIIRTEHNQ